MKFRILCKSVDAISIGEHFIVVDELTDNADVYIVESITSTRHADGRLEIHSLGWRNVNSNCSGCRYPFSMVKHIVEKETIRNEKVELADCVEFEIKDFRSNVVYIGLSGSHCYKGFAYCYKSDIRKIIDRLQDVYDNMKGNL